MRIRQIEKSDWEEILKIVKDLRGWFDKHALTFEIPNDLKFHKGLVATENSRILGFLTYSSFEGEVFVSWLGVDPKNHRQGIGKSLVDELENILKGLGIDKLKVETLSEKIEYEPYERTRKFYHKLGFSEAESRNIVSKETGENLVLVTLRKNI